MKHFGCDRCASVVAAHGDMDEMRQLLFQHPQWKDGRPCIAPGCSGQMDLLALEEMPRIRAAARKGLIAIYELEVKEFFRALCGFGMPEELGCAPELVSALLLSASISATSLRRSPTGRTIVDRIELDNGTTIHLAASSHGATVYKITRSRDAMDDDRSELHASAEDAGLPGLHFGDGVHHAEGAAGLAQREAPGGPVVPGSADGEDHRDAARLPADVPGCEGDHDPPAGGGVPEADGQGQPAGSRAGRGDEEHDPGQPPRGSEDVRPDRTDCARAADDAVVAKTGELR